MSSTRTIVRNTAFMFAAQIALRVINPVFSIIIVRQLGDAEFGEYSVMLTWVTLFSVLGDMGIAQYMSREIARDREKATFLFWDVTALRFLLAVLVSIATIGGALLLGYNLFFITATALYCVGYFFQALIVPLSSILAGYERLDVLSVLGVVGQMIYIVAGTVALLVGQNYVWLVAASLVNMPIGILVLVWYVRRYGMSPPPFRLNPAGWWSLIVAGFPFGINQISLTIAYRFDTLLLNSYVAAQVIGWYNAAYGFSRALTSFTAAFSSALVPTLAREHTTDPEYVRLWYYRSFRLLLFTGLPMAVGGSLLADKLMPMLYGEEFQPASLVFAILVWDALLLMYTSLGGNIAQVIRHEVQAARIFGAQAVINLVLNLMVIPQFGMLGATWTTTVTELAGAIFFYRLFRREFGAGLDLKHALRLLFAAGLMGGAVFMLQGLSLFIVIPLGAVVYLLAVWLTNALTKEEQVLMLRLIERVRTRFGKKWGGRLVE